MEERMVNQFYGSLLHDIGKAVQRAENVRKKHQIVGADLLEKFDANREITRSLRYHHINYMSSSLPKDSLSYITYIADNIASGTDRRSENDEKGWKWNSKTPLQDIFNRFGNEPSKRYIAPSELRPNVVDKILPSKVMHDYTPGEYSRGVSYFEEGLSAIEFTEEYAPSVLNLVEATMSFMPSSTNMLEVADISLYDHMKLTAAYACSILQYAREKGIDDYEKTFKNGANSFYKKQAFMLIGFRLEGVQDFIYTITSKGAHKQLRSRAFYVEMMSQWFVDSFLKKSGLTRANVLYSDTEHGYIIVGNTNDNRNIIVEAQKEFNEFLLENFGVKLYMAVGTAGFSASQVMMENSSDEYTNIFREIDFILDKNSKNRYQASEILKLNKAGKKDGRECAVCHSTGNMVDGQNKCELCEKLENFSTNIQKQEFFVINDDSNGLPVSKNAYLSTVTEDEVKKGEVQGRIYAKNRLDTGHMQETHIWVGDYSMTNDYNSYAKRKWTMDENGNSIGINRLGALMIDVDDLYAGFLSGFKIQGEGKYTTMSRYATLSRRLQSFFKLYLNNFAEDKKLSIIYSEGDDVFAIGAWDDILDFVQDVYDYFKKWTDGKMTFSAGVALVESKTPINVIARETKAHLDKAKLSGKDRITLFSEDNVFTFNEYIQDIVFDKLSVIREFFENEQDHGKAFAYKLLDLIRNRSEKDRISFARIAYYLARLEETSQNKDGFGKFKRLMIDWFNDNDEIKRAEMALMLYIYEIREDGYDE
ncbi:type III-A CRISPR-associated protein Cas10/Csm1 [Ligilactobacillus ruminis]|uniref:type III-A CRISPR-associated protein Cas10/Csm1 n=1 Tax=Ligilactobacillus ruminis TaxID=1623 RepID=UPI00189B7F11|nr:type III-A CRISPR-associated protein Cas10/Csm1 [Ligilactobacillus ruminis]